MHKYKLITREIN